MRNEEQGRRVVVLGTGGTIAGRAGASHDNVGYVAGEVPIGELLEGVDAPPGVQVDAEEVAQIDSKDMGYSVWRELVLRCAYWLARPEVAGIVVTHGTDTLEETAFFLQSVLAPAKPVVLTCAMRPASSAAPDGPQNLRDAIAVAAWPHAKGVVAVCAGRIHSAFDVQKVHTYRLDAFDSGDAGVVGHVEEGGLRLVRAWPESPMHFAQRVLARIALDADWPRVVVITSHAEADGVLVDALIAGKGHPGGHGVAGIVLAATGNGTLHRALEAAALRARDAGIAVIRATRCVQGRIVPHAGAALRDAGAMSPVKARIALMLELLAMEPASRER